MPNNVDVEIEHRRLKLSNLEKVLYPEVAFTKAQVIDYYTRVAPVLLPHLEGRPLTLKRYPNGVEESYFYEKQCPSHRPDWVETAAVRLSTKTINFCLVNDLPTLVWAANLASLELHTSLARAPRTDQPTMMVFDLDPGPPADAVQCSQVALMVKAMLDQLGLACFAKTSGSKGIQVYVPLNTPTDYDHTKGFALAVARTLESQSGDLVVSNMKKDLRVGKVFVDWSQNDDHKTTICVYSLRARPRPTVSTPLAWEEVEACAQKGDAEALVFDSDMVLDRVGRMGDLYGGVLEMRQELPAIS